MNSKNILFISLNGHQRQYFNRLEKYLSSYYHVHHVHYAFENIIDGLGAASNTPVVSLSEAEIEDIIQFMLTKAQYRNFGLVRRYLHSEKVLRRQVKSALRYFSRYIQEHNIDLVCVWNGTLVPLAVAAKVAQKLGRKTLFFENGTLPNTTTVDPRGVNNKGSLVGRSADFYQQVQPEPIKLAKLYEKPITVRRLKDKWYHRILKNAPKGQKEAITLPDKYLLIPFQVHDDTQVLLHSPSIKTMQQLLDFVVPAVKAYNSKSVKPYALIVKEHPSDFGRIDYGPLKREYQDSVLFLKYYPTPELIEKAAGIITINSSVGMESLLKHKPVVTLGNAFYNVPGLVKHVTTQTELELALKDLTVDEQLIDHFLYYLRYEYLVEGSWRNPDEPHYESVMKKIELIFRSGET